MVKLSFRVNEIEQIAIDSFAQSLKLSRSEFCRLAIQEKLAKARDIREEQKQESDTQKIFYALNSLNNNILSVAESVGDSSKLYRYMLGGFRRVSQGLIVTNPTRVQELKAVFTDPEIWEKLGMK